MQCTCKFYGFTIKTDFRSKSESSEFRIVINPKYYLGLNITEKFSNIVKTDIIIDDVYDYVSIVINLKYYLGLNITEKLSNIVKTDIITEVCKQIGGGHGILSFLLLKTLIPSTDSPRKINIPWWSLVTFIVPRTC